MHQLNPELNGSDSSKYIESSAKIKSTDHKIYFQQPGIAVLLLDAENLQINTDTEQSLTTVCTCPIQIKIAFANWCSMGKLDIELHGRGYDLIHVPAGRDNADGKMIAFGSSINVRYPNAKEVLVCSSDKVMTNLCNHLQQNGLTVYQVSKQEETVKVFNFQTGKPITIIPILPSEISSIEKFIQQLKILIKIEQKHTQSFWIKLSTLSQIFKNKYKITISQVVSKHFPGKKARDIFINYPADFVIHQIDTSSELYVTLLEINQSQPIDNSNQAHTGKTSECLLLSINSKADFETALKNLIKTLTIQSPKSYVNVGILASKFNQQYSKSITKQMKCLHLSGNFIKFLQSSTSFGLKQTNQGWEVNVL